MVLEAKKYNAQKQIVNGWIPGYHWYRGFRKRHPNISLRMAETENRSKRNITKLQLTEWFEGVSTYNRKNDTKLDMIQ